jgi:nitrogen fixation/metabolism regulation signal transduction histidine kinase
VDGDAYEGEFDPALLAEALKNITTGGRASSQGGAQEGGAEVRLTRQESDASSASGASAVVEWRGAALADVDGDPFRSFTGGAGLRLALAARIIREHGGEVSNEAGVVRARLPLRK